MKDLGEVGSRGRTKARRESDGVKIGREWEGGGEWGFETGRENKGKMDGWRARRHGHYDKVALYPSPL